MKQQVDEPGTGNEGLMERLDRLDQALHGRGVSRSIRSALLDLGRCLGAAGVYAEKNWRASQRRSGGIDARARRMFS
jgi:hypothetical protein